MTLLKAQALWFLQQALVALQLFTAFEDLELKEFMALRTSFSEYDPDLCNEMLATDLTLLLQVRRPLSLLLYLTLDDFN